MLDFWRHTEHYRPASFRLLVVVDRLRVPVVRLAETLLGFAERAGMPVSWALDDVPSRQFARDLLRSQFAFDVAIWGDEGWTDRSVAPTDFRRELISRTTNLRQFGFSPSCLLAEGTAYHGALGALSNAGITEVIHAACGTNRRTELPRGLGFGISDIPLTHRVGGKARWRTSSSVALRRLAHVGRNSTWIAQLGELRTSTAGMLELRNLVETAGALGRRGLLRFPAATPQIRRGYAA